MVALEGLFNEDSETSISAMLSEFWSRWHDIANNPSGASERIALYEQSILLAEQFNSLDSDLMEIEIDLTNGLDGCLDRINEITKEIGIMNNKIVLVIMVLLLIIAGGTGYYSYTLNQRIDRLSQDLAADLTPGSNSILNCCVVFQQFYRQPSSGESLAN